MSGEPPPKSSTKVWWLLGGGILVVVLAIQVVPIALIFSALEPSCGNENLREFVSPGGKLKAVIYRRDCGATTGYSMHVSILAASKAPPNQPGNVFVIDGDETLDAHWQDDTHLVISPVGPGKVLEKIPEFGAVHISYE